MPEYFVVTNSFAAPFFSDTNSRFVEADDPEAALLKVAEEYKHPAGLYAAALYTDANAKEKGEKPLAQWLSNHARGVQDATANKKGGYGYLGKGPGHFEVDGVTTLISDPKGGRIVLND